MAGWHFQNNSSAFRKKYHVMRCSCGRIIDRVGMPETKYYLVTKVKKQACTECKLKKFISFIFGEPKTED